MERIQITVPEQPPAGTIVIDAQGTAWQAKRVLPIAPTIMWHSVDGSGNALRWVHLLAEHGPLDVAHRAGAT